jgi:hypothetical protein
MSKEFYSISPEGELIQFSDGNGNKTAIVIDDDARRIYLFVPDEAPVREKFMAARLATELKRKHGLVFKIQNVDTLDIS